MRKFIIILLAVFYLGIASGATVSLHYCCGKLKKISLLHADEKGCCGSKKMKKNCCKNKAISIKSADKHAVLKNVKIPVNTSIDFYNELPVFEISFHSYFSKLLIPDYHAPPDLFGIPIYLHNRILLI